MSHKTMCLTLAVCGAMIMLVGMSKLYFLSTDNRCQGAQKRVEDTFKVMDACQKLIGCTITVDDLRKAQEQINQAESCK